MHPLKKYSVGLGLLILTVVVACSSAPTTSLVHQSRTPLCVLGCNVGVDIRFDSASGDGVYVSGDTIYVSAGDTTHLHHLYTYWTAGPNAEDTTLSLATRIDSPDCSPGCILPWQESPNPLSLDPEESAGVMGSIWVKDSMAGHTTVTMNVGAGSATRNLVIY